MNKGPEYLFRNESAFQHYGHLLDGIKSVENTPDENYFEENKMLIMLETGVKQDCYRQGLDYSNIDKILLTDATTPANQQAVGGVAGQPGIAGTGVDPLGKAWHVRNTLAMIRQIFPKLYSRELVSVQPVSTDSARLYYMDIMRSDAYTDADGNPVAAGQKQNVGIDKAHTYADSYEYRGYDFSTNQNDPKVNRLNMEIQSCHFQLQELKLNIQVTNEIQRDLEAYHGMNAISILTKAMSDEIALGWDRKVISQMYIAAQRNYYELRSLALQNKTGQITDKVSRTPMTATFDMEYNPISLSGTQSWEDRDHYLATFFEKLEDVATQMYTRTFVRPNFLIVPTDIAAMLRKMKAFDSKTIDMTRQIVGTENRYKAGTLMDMLYNVYVDPYATDVLVGYKGSGWTKTGVVFLPYELGYMTSTFEDPEKFVFKKGMLSRAGIKCVNEDYYGIVQITRPTPAS